MKIDFFFFFFKSHIKYLYDFSNFIIFLHEKNIFFNVNFLKKVDRRPKLNKFEI